MLVWYNIKDGAKQVSYLDTADIMEGLEILDESVTMSSDSKFFGGEDGI